MIIMIIMMEEEGEERVGEWKDSNDSVDSHSEDDSANDNDSDDLEDAKIEYNNSNEDMAKMKGNELE